MELTTRMDVNILGWFIGFLSIQAQVVGFSVGGEGVKLADWSWVDSLIRKSEKKLQIIYPSSSSLLALSHYISLTVKSLGRDVLYHVSATGKTQRQTEMFEGKN